jgi:UDP-glucuronate decarboxylase
MYRILEEDFEYIVSNLTELNKLQNSIVFITGATGFIGSLIVKALDYANKKNNLNITIRVLVRNKSKAEEILKGCNVFYINGDICNLPEINEKIDYIIHCAAVTKSKEMIDTPVEVIEGIVNGTHNILKLGYYKQIKSMVYLSSMEVYGRTEPELKHVGEANIGYIDIQNTRSCYPLGKRMAENLCYCYNAEYNVPVKVARLAQTFGAGILKNETRIFSQFAKSIIHNTDIILHTDGSSTGNYCYSADALIGMFLLLLNGDDGEIYNIANENTCMTIRQMAELVAKNIAHGNISVKFEIPEGNQYGYAAPVEMKLSSDKIRKLGWRPKYGLEEMYRRMISYMLEDEQ